MSAGMFLLATLWVIIGVCAGLFLLTDNQMARGVDLRHGLVLLALAFAGVIQRGDDFAWLGWPPMLAATVLTYRFIRLSAERVRARKLLSRTLRHS